MRKFISASLLFFLSLSLNAQKGEFYLTHYAPEDERIENENYAIVQDLNGQMQFANARGILKFDGRYWQLTKTPSTVLSLEVDNKTGIVYAGCLDNFGYINTDFNGNDVYISIMKSSNKFLSISKIVILEDYVYFLGYGTLFEYSKSLDKITNQWESGLLYDFDNIFEFQNALYISDLSKGLLKVNSKKLIDVSTNLPKGEKIEFATRLNDKLAFIGTSANKYYVFDGQAFVESKVKDAEYLKNSIANNALLLKNNIVVISTNKGGCLILNLATGETVSIINYYSGLPDDEIFAIGLDNQSGIWMAHEYGFTRVDFYLPFKSFSNYPGLGGNLESAVTYMGKLFVATSEGVYYLDEVRDYTEVIKYVKVESKTNKVKKVGEKRGKIKSKADKFKFFLGFKKQSAPEVKKEEEVKEEKKERKFLGIFRRKNKEPEEKTDEEEQLEEKPTKKKDRSVLGIFKRKNRTTNEDVEKAHVTVSEAPKLKPTAKSRSSYKVKKTIEAPKHQQVISFELKSIKYQFKKIPGIDSKCKQILIYKNKLLVGTNNGVFEIEGVASKKITPYSITYLYLSRDETKLIAGTDNNTLVVFRNENNSWIEEKVIQEFAETVTNIAEDINKNVWVSLSNNVLKYPAGNFDKAESYQINNPFSDDIHLISVNDKTYIIVASDTYRYNQKNEKLEKEKLLSVNHDGYMQLIHSESDVIWFNNGEQWSFISNMPPNKNFSYFKLFKGIQGIFLQNDKNHCWIITRDNNLYNVDISSQVLGKNVSNIFLRGIKDNNGNPLQIREIEFTQNASNVSFSFINPEYLDNSSLQYQYKLKGFNKEWSNWSYENQVNFNYLPSGRYELLVRTKNTLNQITESQPLIFNVKPPYWMEWWFYLFEFLLFGTLLILSIVINSITHKNSWISRGLTFLTIVMLIEFVNTVLESYFNLKDSPVQSFMVQVFLAILILPFERVLSKFITHDSKKSLAKMKSGLKKLPKEKG